MDKMVGVGFLIAWLLAEIKCHLLKSELAKTEAILSRHKRLIEVYIDKQSIRMRGADDE